jgi:hypothetical protein
LKKPVTSIGVGSSGKRSYDPAVLDRVTMSELPFDISKQSAGAQRAYDSFVEFYGKSEGTRIFLQKAEDEGKGNTIRQKVNSIYHKGATLGKST